jgi:hypothetical protein
LQEWITAVDAMPTIEPGGPWENGYIDSFNAPYGQNNAPYALKRWRSRVRASEISVGGAHEDGGRPDNREVPMFNDGAHGHENDWDSGAPS